MTEFCSEIRQSRYSELHPVRDASLGRMKAIDEFYLHPVRDAIGIFRLSCFGTEYRHNNTSKIVIRNF